MTYAPEKLCAAQVGQVYAPDEISEICVRVARWGARGGVPWGVAAGPGQPGWGSGWAATGTMVACPSRAMTAGDGCARAAQQDETRRKVKRSIDTALVS